MEKVVRIRDLTYSDLGRQVRLSLLDAGLVITGTLSNVTLFENRVYVRIKYADGAEWYNGHLPYGLRDTFTPDTPITLLEAE